MKRMLFLAFFALLFSAALCSAGMPSTGDVILRVRDAQLRPVVGANATFEYVLTDPLLGELHKTDVMRTNQFGIAQKRLTADYNTPYTITVAHHGVSSVERATWLGGFDRFVNLPLLDFTVRAIDTDGNAIPNIQMAVQSDNGEEFTMNSNATGYCLFSQYDSNAVYTIHAAYGGAEATLQVVPDGRLHALQFATYALEIKTFRDDASTLLTTQTVRYSARDEVVRTSTGIAGLFSQIPEGDVEVNVTYGNMTVTDRFYLNTSTSKTYIFDMHAPLVGMPALSPINPVPENEVVVMVNVTDPGPNGSGLPDLINMIPPVELYYSTDGATWKSAHMYPEANNVTYRGRVPGMPKNSIVRYYFVAWDNANNTATSARYSYNTIVNATCENCTNGPSLIDDALAFLWGARWWISVILIVAAAAYYFMRSRS